MKSLIPLILLLSAFSCPAQQYWQQRVDTKIDVQLDDHTNFLYGFEEITYTNNSPDTLQYIYIHLWPNAYKNDRTPFAEQQYTNKSLTFYYSKPQDRGYIDSLQFTVNGNYTDYYSTDNVPDIARLNLHQPLLPGGQIHITTPFRVKIPKVFSRLGHSGQAYYISQWFPKPAVYDRKGWHPISFLDQGEFYSDYGSYDVSITLPKNYIVMATGNCTDTNEEAWLDSLAKQPLPNDSMYRKSWPVSSDTMKTIHFHENNVHDFAWFADKRWVVRKDTVYSPGNNQLVTTWTAFLPYHTKYWIKGTDYLKATVQHYGKWVGPYPYKTIKAVDGDMHAGGGMEYPTVTIIDKGAVTDLQTTIVHEAGHNWFYGILGTNERDHAWMDEGINTFYEQKTDRELGGKNKADKLNNDITTLFYYEAAKTHTDQAIDQTSANFTDINYGLDVYYKTAMLLRWLEQYMGEADFESGMHDYYNTWHHKHPYPEDLYAVMQKHTSKPVGWFFNGMLRSNKKIDYTLRHVRINDDATGLTIHSKSNITAPAAIEIMHKDSVLGTVWSYPFTNDTTIQIPANYNNLTSLRIAPVIPDCKLANNTYYRTGLFHKFGIGIRPLAGFNHAKNERLFISPAIGYNQYDGFMAGLLFHNLTIPENSFQFAFAPMYATRSKTFAGAGTVGYTWYPDNLFREILLQADVKSFDYDTTTLNTTNKLYARYFKIAPSLNFTFNEHDPLSPVTRILTLKAYSITEDQFDFGADSLSKPTTKQQNKIYGLLRYTHTNSRALNPFNYRIEGQLGADFGKLSATGNIRINYYTPHKSLYVRGYVGKFFAINNDPAVTSRYYLNSSFTGSDDYLYDGTYIGRNVTNGLGAQQIEIQEGGFKIPTHNNVGRSDNWLAAINLKSDLPLGKLPVRLFLDAGLMPNATPDEANPSDTRILYDGGIEIHLIQDFLDIYVPIIMSSDFQNYLRDTYGNKKQFVRGISFSLALRNINWLKAPSRIINFVK